jgi:GIY-YIG catalytic domain
MLGLFLFDLCSGACNHYITGAIMYTIYKAVHIPTGKFYIGQTKQRLQIRIGQHWGDYRAKTRFHLFLQDTQMNDWEWTVLNTVATYGEARDCELYYINQLNAYEIGLNSKTGSSDHSIRQQSSERMKSYRAANPEPWNKGRKGCYSPETIDRMRVARLKNPTKYTYTDKEKRQRSLAAPNRTVVKELKTDKTFHSISEAARHFGLRRECVRDVVNGKRGHTAGYVFMRVEK